MMKKYIDEILNNRVTENKGYVYVTTETIEIPIYKVTLSISKRHMTNLELVEEMILRLSSVGITNLDTMSGVLGLPREIIDITVGDLHLKDLAFHSSGNCVLMGKGRESVKSLSVSNREKDILRNVFVDAITGSISGEKDIHYKEGHVHNDAKMKHIFDANSIDHYRCNMDSIRLIFDQLSKTYIDENMKLQDELVSVESIDDIITGFISVPIHIYVSESGFEVDIIAQRRSQKQLLEEHKEAIIEQLRTRKLLPNLTSYRPNVHFVPSGKEGYSCEEQYEHLKKLETNCSGGEFDKQVRSILYGPRMLFENELLNFCRHIFPRAKKIEIMIDNLNYWSKNPKFITICTFIDSSTNCYVFYRDSNENVIPSLRRIENSCPNIHKKQVQNRAHTEWFKIIVDSRLSIEIYSEAVKVFADNRFMLRMIAYIS